MNNKKIQEENNTDKLIITLTRRCQFSCGYCHMDIKDKEMSEPILKDAIDFLFTSKEKDLKIQFFGGEPLLAFALLKKGVAYAKKLAKKKNKEISFSITTNGLILNDYILDFLNYNKVRLMFSLDGDPETFKQNRTPNQKNTTIFEKIISNINKAAYWGSDYFVNMVVTPETSASLPGNISYLIKNKIDRIKISYELGKVWKNKDKETFLGAVRQSINKFNIDGKDPVIINEPVAEPVLSSPALIVDIDGSVYRGCSIVLENKLPFLHSLFKMGNLRDIGSIDKLKISREDQKIFMLSNKKLPKKELEIVENNISFGNLAKSLLKNKDPKDLSCSETMNKIRSLRKKLASIEQKNPTSESLMVMITTACQLRCDYCQVKLGNTHMPKKILFKSVDLVSKSKGQGQLRFFGGEPLLRFDMIKQAIFYSEKKRYNIRFSITTNGILLTKERLNFLKDHDTHVMLSADGLRECHDMHRSYDGKNTQHSKIIQNLKSLIRSGIPYFVNIVATPDTIGKVEDNVRFFAKLGVKNLQVCYESALNWKLKYAETFKRFLKNARLIEEEFGIKIMNFCNNCEPVMPGREIIVDIDGKVYYDAAIFLEKKFPELRKAYFISDIAKIDKLADIQKSKPELVDIFSGSIAGKRQKEELLLNNLNFGLEIIGQMEQDKAKTLKNNENPFFKSFISGDLRSQQDFKKRHNISISSYILHIKSSCDNDCIICRNKKETEESIEFISARLAQNKTYGLKKIALVGNDPLTHTKIIDIIRGCKKNNFKEVEISTSGNRLNDKQLLTKLSEIGIKIEFSFPLMGPDSRTHDNITQNKGSFSKIMDGIKNIKALPNLGAFIHTNIIRQNIETLDKLEHMVRKKLGFPFVMLPIRPKDSILPYEKLIPPYSEISEKIHSKSLLGFPLCCSSRHNTMDLASEDDISDSMKAYFLDQRFVKLKTCRDCIMLKNCSGTFKEYAKRYGVGEFNPIKEDRQDISELKKRNQSLYSKKDSNLKTIKEFYVILTLNCSLKCKVCPYWGKNGACRKKDFAKKYLKNTISKKEIKNMVDDLKRYKISNITFSGGEPLEQKNWYDIAKAFTNLDSNLTLTTNGTKLKGNIDKICSVFDQINISLEGSPKEVFSSIRIAQGTKAKSHLKDIISSLKKIRSRNKDIRLKMLYVVSDITYLHIEELLDYLKNQGLDFDEYMFQYQMFVTKKRLKDHKDQLSKEFGINTNLMDGFLYSPKPINFKKMKCAISNIQKKYPNSSFSPDLNPEELNRYYSDPSSVSKDISCNAPWNQVSLLPNGELWICHDYPIGNIKSQRFSQAWGGKKAEALRKRIRNKGQFPACGSCFYLYG